jgi:hypothetical protein
MSKPSDKSETKDNKEKPRRIEATKSSFLGKQSHVNIGLEG